MLVKLTSYKLKSATIVEAVVALLVIMLSVSAGMMIFGKVVYSGVHGGRNASAGKLEMLVDSMIAGKQLESKIVRRKNERISITVSKRLDYPDAQVVRAIATDIKGDTVADISKVFVDENRIKDGGKN